MLLDQRRAGDPVTRLERAAVIGRRVGEAGAREVDRTRAAERAGRRMRPAFRDVLEAGLRISPTIALRRLTISAFSCATEKP